MAKPTIARRPASAVQSDHEQKSFPIDPSITIDYHKFVHMSAEYPIIKPDPQPSMAEGRDDVDKPFQFAFDEQLWLSIERHCKAINIGKSEWVRRSMKITLEAEQIKMSEGRGKPGDDLHKYVHRTEWPILGPNPSPSLVTASTEYQRPFRFLVRDRLAKTVERHIKALGVSKVKWVKYAILSLMEEEQLAFFDMARKEGSHQTG